MVGTVASIQYRPSLILVEGLEIPIHMSMTFSHSSKPIIDKMKEYIEKQTSRMEQIFTLQDEDDNEFDEIEDIVRSREWLG